MGVERRGKLPRSPEKLIDHLESFLTALLAGYECLRHMGRAGEIRPPSRRIRREVSEGRIAVRMIERASNTCGALHSAIGCGALWIP